MTFSQVVHFPTRTHLNSIHFCRSSDLTLSCLTALHCSSLNLNAFTVCCTIFFGLRLLTHCCHLCSIATRRVTGRRRLVYIALTLQSFKNTSGSACQFLHWLVYTVATSGCKTANVELGAPVRMVFVIIYHRLGRLWDKAGQLLFGMPSADCIYPVVCSISLVHYRDISYVDRKFFGRWLPWIQICPLPKKHASTDYMTRYYPLARHAADRVLTSYHNSQSPIPATCHQQ